MQLDQASSMDTALPQKKDVEPYREVIQDSLGPPVYISLSQLYQLEEGDLQHAVDGAFMVSFRE